MQFDIRAIECYPDFALKASYILCTVHGVHPRSLLYTRTMFDARFHGPADAEVAMLHIRLIMKEDIIEEDAGRGVKMLEFSMVVLVYDRLCGAGICWLAELALCEFREGHVEAGAKGVRNPKHEA